MNVEVTFPAEGKPFLPRIYLRRTEGRVEIGAMNKQGDDYVWATIPMESFDAAVSILKIEDKFTDD